MLHYKHFDRRLLARGQELWRIINSTIYPRVRGFRGVQEGSSSLLKYLDPVWGELCSIAWYLRNYQSGSQCSFRSMVNSTGEIVREGFVEIFRHRFWKFRMVYIYKELYIFETIPSYIVNKLLNRQRNEEIRALSRLTNRVWGSRGRYVENFTSGNPLFATCTVPRTSWLYYLLLEFFWFL